SGGGGRVGSPSRSAAEGGAPAPVGTAAFRDGRSPGPRATPSGAGGPAPSSPAARARALGPVLATPATRKLARELGVDLRGVFGTGPSARITSDDVRNHVGGGRAPAGTTPTPPPNPISREPGDVAIPF